MRSRKTATPQFTIFYISQIGVKYNSFIDLIANKNAATSILLKIIVTLCVNKHKINIFHRVFTQY